MTTFPPPKALLFDWDNTLVDTWATIHHVLEQTFLAFGREPWTPQEVRQRVRASARDTFPALFGENAEAATRHFYETFERCHLEQLRALPGAAEGLARLGERRLYLAVVSNKTGDYLRREAEVLGWDGHFRRLIGATDAARDKPAVDPVELALQGSGFVRGPEVWFVGDTDIDMACARNAGCTGVLLREAAPRDDEFAEGRPHVHVADFDELINLVDRSIPV